MTSNALVKVENVSLAFGRREILRKISFTLGEGDILHVRGPNGAGKTTLLRLLAGFLPPTHGKVTFSENTKIAYLESESNGHLLSLSGSDNLTLFEEESFQNSLERWNLPATGYLKDLPVSSYSTGMKRRLALARLETARANLFLLDEPTNGLDSQGIQVFQWWLNQCLEKKQGAIIVSHDASIFAGISVSTLEI